MDKSKTFFIGYLTGAIALVIVYAIDTITNNRGIIYIMAEFVLVCVICGIGLKIAEMVGKGR